MGVTIEFSHCISHAYSSCFTQVLTSLLRLLLRRDECAAVDSSRLLTGSSDSTAKLWEVETGNCLHTFKFQSPCRAVAYSIDEQMAALSTDPFMAQEPAINLVRMAQDPADQSSEVVQQLTGFSKRITRVAWTDLNEVLVTAGEDGYVRRWDVEVMRKPSLPCFCWELEAHLFAVPQAVHCSRRASCYVKPYPIPYPERSDPGWCRLGRSSRRRSFTRRRSGICASTRTAATWPQRPWTRQ